MLSIKHLRLRLFGLSPAEASFARRGFWQGHARQRLEHIGLTFLRGYQIALEETEPDELVSRLNLVEPELLGFAFEGAAMSLALLDLITPWKKDRWLSFIEGGGAKHIYMAHVGAGWALARLQRWRTKFRGLSEPVLRWLAVDGYGFHEGYFYWQRFVRDRALPERLEGYSRRVFDQGLGRSIWFVDGADTERIGATISAFPASRQADLWSGVGLACAYAGGVDQPAIKALQAIASSYTSQLAQGAAFAAKTRQRADNPAEHTEMACRILCCMSANDAAVVTDKALENLPRDERVPAYEVWRQRIQAQFLCEVA